MSNHIVRNSIGSLAQVVSQAPHLYDALGRLSSLRRRHRAARVAKHAAWLGAGLVLGAGLATLLSPRTGKQVRRQISDQAKQARDYITSKASSAKNNGIAHVELS